MLLKPSAAIAQIQGYAYYVLGQEELINKDIYGICQTDDEKLYVATNYGLYRYSHGNFFLIPQAKGQHGMSLFSLNAAADGTLYCANISGQIIRVRDNVAEVIYQMPFWDDGSDVPRLFVDDQGAAIVLGRQVVRINPEGGIAVILEEKEKNQYYRGHLTTDNSILIYHYREKVLYRWQEGKLLIEPVAFEPVKKDFYSNIGTVGDHIFQYSPEVEIKFFTANPPVNTLRFQLRERFWKLNKNELIGIGYKKGVRSILLENDSLKETLHFLKDHGISAIFKGKNNSIFLATFGQGIIVIPNRSVRILKMNATSQSLKAVATTLDNKVYFSNDKGELYSYYKDSLQHHTAYKYLRKLFYPKDFQSKPATQFSHLIHNRFGIPPVKNACLVNDGKTALVATSSGVYAFGEALAERDWIDCGPRFPEQYKLVGLHKRCKAVAYAEDEEKIWVATHNGLFTITNDMHQEEVLYQGRPISCSSLVYSNGIIYCATQKEGLLLFKDGKVWKHYGQHNGLDHNSIKKILLKGNALYILGLHSFQILDTTTDQFTTLGMAEGINGMSLRDFDVSADKLWLINHENLFSIHLDDIPQTQATTQLYMDSIRVSGSLVAMGENKHFTHDQNRFSFYPDFRNIEYAAETQLLYKMNGFDEDWNTTALTTPIIEYRSLPPGNYNFIMKAVYRGESLSYYQYPIIIKAPFWETWWFYVLLTLVLGGGLSLVFVYRIKNIKKKNTEKLLKQKMAAELLDTKLKALRSQMNPHFIFNSLNSIQDLILQQDTDASYDYIVLFADLVRSTLSYSDRDFIPIEKELHFLEVYLSLEKLRFKDDFAYSISYKGDSEIEVPSLIVQPFIENALLHGLLHKEGLKTLDIVFEINGKLICTVTDNGIGREKAKKISQRQAQNHESFSLQAIQNRMAILQEQYGMESGYQIKDRMEDDQVAGTIVEITIPHQKRF